MAGSDPEVASRINNHHQQQLDCFEEAFARAIQKGLLSADRDPHALALFFINTMKGLRVMAKMKPSRETLQAVVDIALIVLD
jgi:TetR/AcrR family transcriptional repressor of nem operon